MSHAAIAAVLRLEDVGAGERLAAFSLASFANREHRAWPGTQVAAARAGLSRSQYLAARDGLARRGLVGWSSHKDHAAKALKKLAGPHLPGSLRQLETAVKRAHDDAVRAEREACDVQPAGSAAETESRETSGPTEDKVSPDADGENCNAADLAESATA